jgi:hypothetical protein
VWRASATASHVLEPEGIWIGYPLPAHPERWGISHARIRNEVIPLLDREPRRKTLR